MKKRYRKQLALAGVNVAAQYSNVKRVPGFVDITGPAVEQDVEWEDGVAAQTDIDDFDARMLADDWEFVEEDPATQSTMICCDANGESHRLEHKINGDVLRLSVDDAIYPTSDPAESVSRNDHKLIAFDDTTPESVIWRDLLPGNFNGADLLVTIYWLAATAVEGEVVWGCEWERNAVAGHDIDADSWGIQRRMRGTAPDTSGVLQSTVLRFSQSEADDIGSGESFRLRIQRLASQEGNSGMSGDAQIFGVTVKEAPAPLASFVDGIFTNPSARYVWYDGVLYGPFAGGTLATICIGDEIFGQFELAGTNAVGYSEDFTQWTTIGGASVAGNTTEAPDGNTTADTLTFGAAATDGIKLALGVVTADADQTKSIFVKTASGTKDFRIGFLRKDGTTSYSGDLTATTYWQRLDFTADILAGATPAEARIINDSGGNAGDIIIFGSQVDKDKSFPSSYIPSLAGNSETRAKDQFYWTNTDVPAVMYGGAGAWEFKCVPFFAHDESGPSYNMIASSNGAASDYLDFNASTKKVELLDGGNKRLSNALTHARHRCMAHVLDNDDHSIEIIGADSGDGEVVGSAYAWNPANNLYYGMYYSTSGRYQFNGLVSQPRRPS